MGCNCTSIMDVIEVLRSPKGQTKAQGVENYVQETKKMPLPISGTEYTSYELDTDSSGHHLESTQQVKRIKKRKREDTKKNTLENSSDGEPPVKKVSWSPNLEGDSTSLISS